MTVRTTPLNRLIAAAGHDTQLVLPLFIREGLDGEEAAGIPGVCRYGIGPAVEAVGQATRDGVTSFLLFGVPAAKGLARAVEPDNVVAEAIRALRTEFGASIALISDIGFSPYSDDGHSTVRRGDDVDVEATLDLAGRMAATHAAAGVDAAAPCMSIRGQVGYLRRFLDRHHPHVGVMGYSAKYASSLYGPFRDTVKSPLRFGGKEAYQHALWDGDGGVGQMLADQRDGADIVMVKPAMCYLDVVHAARGRVEVPIAVYNVSGEIGMIRAGIDQGLLGEDEILRELLHAFRRAGARIVISYAARSMARLVRGMSFGPGT